MDEHIYTHTVVSQRHADTKSTQELVQAGKLSHAQSAAVRFRANMYI